MEIKDKNNEFVKQVAEQKYEFGFTTDVHTDIIEKGLDENIIRLISICDEYVTSVVNLLVSRSMPAVPMIVFEPK